MGRMSVGHASRAPDRSAAPVPRAGIPGAGCAADRGEPVLMSHVHEVGPLPRLPSPAPSPGRRREAEPGRAARRGRGRSRATGAGIQVGSGSGGPARAVWRLPGTSPSTGSSEGKGRQRRQQSRPAWSTAAAAHPAPSAAAPPTGPAPPASRPVARRTRTQAAQDGHSPQAPRSPTPRRHQSLDVSPVIVGSAVGFTLRPVRPVPSAGPVRARDDHERRWVVCSSRTCGSPGRRRWAKASW